MIWQWILDLVFPPKCIVCQKLLSRKETDLCHKCRIETPEFTKAKHKISFVAGFTALWYYSDEVRHSLLLYKFHNHRSHGSVYGRLLAMKLNEKPFCDYDILTWVPVSPQRRWKRGYDQVELIARSVGKERGTPAVSVLQKVRDPQPQSRLTDISKRKANVLGAFEVKDPTVVAGKRILLLDDIITTGATVSECARVLQTAGAKEVYCAAVAALNKEKRR